MTSTINKPYYPMKLRLWLRESGEVLGDQRQDIVNALALITPGNNRSVCICVHLW